MAVTTEMLLKVCEQQVERATTICHEGDNVCVARVQRTMEIGWNDARTLCQIAVDQGRVAGLPVSPHLTN